MDNIKNLLNQVKIISEKNAEILDATGGRFNMFRVCGVNRYENTHSAIIAEFLNPKGSHGLKAKLLECFIETLGETLGNNFKVVNFSCENANVFTEYSIDDRRGRMDIFIKDNQGKVIIIENKIDAGDQPEQLKRYNKYAEKKYKGNYQILYLKLDGSDASEQSAGGVKYLPISYKETIIKWLDKCIAIATRFPMVRETINQYINHLKYLTNQDMDTKNKEEIAKLIASSSNNLEIANNIVRCFDEAKQKVLIKFWEKLNTCLINDGLSVPNKDKDKDKDKDDYFKKYDKYRKEKYTRVEIPEININGYKLCWGAEIEDNFYTYFRFYNNEDNLLPFDETNKIVDCLRLYELNKDKTSLWKYSNPQLNFKEFNSPEIFALADEKYLEEVVEKIVKEASEDIDKIRGMEKSKTK